MASKNKMDINARVNVSSMFTSIKKQSTLQQQEAKRMRKQSQRIVEGRKRVAINVPVELWERVQAYAYTHRIGVSEATEKMLSAYLNQRWNVTYYNRKKKDDD